MTASAVMTVRIDPELLAALKRKATEEGRSVSAEVVRLIRREVEARPARRRRVSGFGMFRGYETVEVEDIRALRMKTTAAAKRSARRRGRR